MTLQEFIREHRNDDVRQLALQMNRFPEIAFSEALQQIAGWQAACKKLPSWAENDAIKYPPHLSMEQCSSERTARYKQRLVCRTFNEGGNEGESTLHHAVLIDLTGGFGVDFSFMAKDFGRAVYVERQSDLCETARHNFRVFGLKQAEVVCADGVDYLQRMPEGNASDHTFIYIDPARRDRNGHKTYAIEDCTPDVAGLRDVLLSRARRVLIKLSPMLDWHRAVEVMGSVGEVHIVSTGNECKELLLLLDRRHESGAPLRVVCADDDRLFCYQTTTGDDVSDDNETCAATPETVGTTAFDGAPDFLLVPNASVMKAGCFAELQRRYGVRPLSANSHLFLSATPADGFPGRQFRIVAQSSINRRELQRALQGIDRANIAVRNFPLTADELRKRLKLRDGGDVFLFATTDKNRRHVVFVTRKAASAVDSEGAADGYSAVSSNTHEA